MDSLLWFDLISAVYLKSTAGFAVTQPFFHHGFHDQLLKFWRVSFVWFSSWHNKSPHLLDSISYCLTNGVLFHTKLLWDFCSSVQEFASQHFLLTSSSLQIFFLPPRFAPVPSANASYCQTRSGLSSPSCCPCWAHLNNNTPKYLFQLWGVVCVLLDTHRMQRRKMNS